MNSKYKLKTVNVIGAGLAGSEAAWQLAQRGIKVKLYEMKPNKFTPAHKSKYFSELVCSNSLRSNDLFNAAGLLKHELRLLDSLVINAADKFTVPAGSALAVDREKFSKYITEKLVNHENIEIINKEVKAISINEPTILSTGPLTSNDLMSYLKTILSDDGLYFFDAVAPIVKLNSIDMNNAFFADRYDKGNKDYLNCPMTKDEYEIFYKELINAKTVELKDFEYSKIFEGCMPIEVMAKRGKRAMLFGPLKPVGIKDNEDKEKKYHAVVQLRREDAKASLLNMVGFQTNLKFKEQKRVFSLIPALKNAEFVRYG
ncbi:MAG: methylenetetrahydrofolate--tRNA-(uracil(54)-C(5))-methyltransferase (FADH(2)-oxidizing) TrmFO, partial [Candidatus Woesearchaeota archaeon]